MELEDIQGLLVRGHSDMLAAEYLLLKIVNPWKFKSWLVSLIPQITNGASKPPQQRLQIAFTWEGIKMLGAELERAINFRPEFIQGLNTDYRARLLGDLGESDRSNWEWGGPGNESVHLTLMLFAPDKDLLELKSATLQSGLMDGGLVLVHRLSTEYSPKQREHFGFRDGISQPILPGLKKKGSRGNPEIPAGEFILGYKNGYNEYPDSPLVPSQADPNMILPKAAVQAGMVDFGKNGSYMVFRQLKQEVKQFWNFLEDAVKKENSEAGADDAIQLAAKMVGRWPSGCPVTLSPKVDKESMGRENNFLFNAYDAKGYQCPVGSHVRRSNPRDSLQHKNAQKAMKISQRHRILRRGRIFGPPLTPDFDPRSFLQVEDDGQSRGLHFICFNTNIARQFEFIQHTWTDNSKFQGMYEDPDPVLGIKDSRNKAHTHDFTIPAKPLRRKIQGLKRHVHVIGGAYFFMPGIRALRFLAQYSSD